MRWLPLVLVLVFPAAAAVPVDDPGADRIAHQWYLDTIGVKGLVDDGIDGRGIVVAVLDSGVTHTHPDLMKRMWRNVAEVAGNGIDDDLNGYVDDVAGWDMCNDAPARPEPPLFHGTFVAGVVAADGRGHDGVLGVAPAATIMDVQAFCDDDQYAPQGGTFDPDAVREAIAYAIDNGAHIIQMSMQGWPDHGPGLVDGLLQEYAGLAEEFQRAHEEGVVVVAAAGNKGASGPSSPADRPHVIAVGATTGCGPRHTFSNHGAGIDVWAPGRALSTSPEGYGWDVGTSFAAPMVSGAAALILQKEPTLLPDQVLDRILASAGSSDDGPILDLRPVFAAPLPESPAALRYIGPTAVGSLHYLQYETSRAAPLLHVRIPGAGEWCFDNATMEPLWIDPANLPPPALVSVRLHNGVAAGPWLNVTFTHDPRAPDGTPRDLLVIASQDPAGQMESPALWPAVTLLAAAMLRRSGAPGRPPRTPLPARHG